MQTKIISEQYRIAANHPCLIGHFPDNPIIPAVVQLDYARRLLHQWRPEIRLVAIPHAKFRQPLRPEQDFSINLSVLDADSVRFECIRAGEMLATGLFRIEVKQ